MPSGTWPRYLAAASLLLALALAVAGCGSSGPAGAAGSDGTSVDTGITTGTTLTAADNAPGVVLAVTSVTGQTGPTGNFRVGDKPVVTFTIKKTNGVAWHLNEMGSGRILISGPTEHYQRVLPRANDLVTASVVNGDGSYTYTFATGLPAVYATPDNDQGNYPDGNMKGQALEDGTYTIGLVATWNYTVDGVAKRDIGNTTKDILIGATATLASREVVKKENCNTCHVQVQAHGGSYKDTRVCVLCHTAGTEDRTHTAGVEFKVMIHRIHNGAHLPSVLGVASDPTTGERTYTGTATPYVVAGNDFSSVVFPVFPNFNVSMPRRAGYSALSSGNKTKETAILRGITACYKCHGDPDGAGALTAPSQGLNCYQQPSRRACGSCHDDVNFSHSYTANGKTMVAQPNDGACTTCHAPSGTTLADGIAIPGVGTEPATPYAHIHPIADVALVPGAAGYTAAGATVAGYTSGLKIAVSTVTGSTAAYFVNGEKPAITFTIKDDANNNVPLYKLSGVTTTVTGPTNNRQLVFPVSGLRGNTAPICDFTGRLVLATGSSGNGIMSRVVGSLITSPSPATRETLKVQFTSATAFTVWGGGSALTDFGSGALPASPSTNASGTSISAIELTTAAVAQNITINFPTTNTGFTVTGSVSGLMGSGTMPASTSAVTRFTSTDGTVSFTITSGTTAFGIGNNIYLTVFQTNTNGHKFAIVAGRSANSAGDRFYYETVDNALTSYTYNVPMDIILENLGNGTGAAGDVFTVANPQVYWGRESAYERTATAGGNSTLSADAAVRARYVTVGSAASFAANDYVVLDDGTATVEYIQINKLVGTQLWFNTPLRHAHATGVTCKEVALTLLKESINYTLNPTTGAFTTIAAVGAGNAVVVTYRTDGSFGWKRAVGDSIQAVYQPPQDDSPTLGQDWGEWQGLTYQNGTYTAGIWGSLPIYVSPNNEVQTYSVTSNAGQGNFLYGATGTVAPYNLITSQGNCDSCHDGVLFHGGGRKGNDACALCHSIAGLEDNTQTGITAKFSTMLHKAHMGEGLTNASTYAVNGSVGLWAEVVFPAMPGKTKACETCHGTANTAWKSVPTRTHASQTIPTKNYMVVCNSCHDSTAAATHTAAMTAASGAESCVTCHAAGQAFGVDTVHKNR